MTYWTEREEGVLTRLKACCGYTGRQRGVSKVVRLSRGIIRDQLSGGELCGYRTITH